MLEILQREEFESIKITHLIPFIKGSLEHASYKINNVRMLSYILPFAFQNPTDYHANFYYEDFSIGQTNLLFPYYLVSDKYVLVFSRDYKNAMLLRDSPHAYYKGAFEKLNYSATSLFQYLDTPLSVLEEYCSLKQTNCAYALDRQPCILHYIDEDMPNNPIYEHVELKQLITDVILARHHQLQEITETITTFTRQELVDFVKNGIIYDYPQEFSRPFTPEERLLIFNRILASNKAGKIFHPCQEFTCFSSGSDALFTFFSDGTSKFVPLMKLPLL